MDCQLNMIHGAVPLFPMWSWQGWIDVLSMGPLFVVLEEGGGGDLDSPEGPRDIYKNPPTQ